MRTQSRDTSPAVERFQIAGLRTFSPARRFALTRALSADMMAMNLAPGADGPGARAQDWVRRVYGERWARAVRRHVEHHPQWILQPFDLGVVLARVVRVLERQQLRYALTGSLAGCVYGLPRGVRDVDLVVRLGPEDLALLKARLGRAFFVASGGRAGPPVWETPILGDVVPPDARARRGHEPRAAGPDPQGLDGRLVLKALHRTHLVGVDVLVPSEGSAAPQVLERAQLVPLLEERGPMWVLSPEDVALTRLAWYRATGGTADDQWNDLLGLLKVQALELDVAYLHAQAWGGGLQALLARALEDAGVAA